MILKAKASLITLFSLPLLLAPLEQCADCAAPQARPGMAAEHYPAVIRLDELLAFAETTAAAGSGRRNSPAPLPAYAEALLADGRLSIGLGIGTEDLGAVRLARDQEGQKVKKNIRICGRPVEVEARFILTREDFRQALGDCEIIFVTSHSRFGAGPVFRNDGKAFPFLMQQTKGYEIVMPDEEICGFTGKIKRRFYNQDKGKYYTVFEPDGSDLDKARPLHGYQLLVLSTCTSMKHFGDEIKKFRSPYPTTAILTQRAACLDTGMNIFMCLLAQIFQARELPAVVKAMNAEYNAVAAREARKGVKAWKQVDNMYVLGINTLP